ncbi:uncharacterized protein LOC112574217 [Pomacea canaliculata]|uniref:uncharacterized protein LOC112574217 n=1 Tax=Pomacea canaliculata TaxID=400727 RepID=UPI000D737B2E|nr:uncharacterized protein LOC112574217 [Pomacea canaliculata]XP_025110902.1 uncharacterized protein LOC112574217 [Pomacea canaliculata]XP_025110903.1 uncharacterized protein LOC112574217 [Pomacea canaliculata]XP_025110904.1 uncharacterized protein LOC112574217 [Pomacea canaliculata]
MIVSLTRLEKLCLCAFVVGVGVFVMGFSVPYWVTFPSSTSRFGLWELCSTKGAGTCCFSTLSKDFRILGERLPGWFRGAQTCACFALMCIMATFVCRIFFIFKNLENFHVPFIILDILAAVFAIVTAVIFGSEVTKYTNLSLSWSFAFDIMGGILFAVSGACCFVKYCCHT